MKAKNLFFGALACLAFAACSNDDEPVVNNPSASLDGSGYIAISINLPTQNTTTRANDGKVVLDDGLASEYAVKNATLLIFSENTLDGVYVETHDLSTEFKGYSDDPNHITQTSEKVIKQVSSSITTNHAMLVVLNNNGIDLSETEWSGKTLKQFMQTTSTAIKTTTEEGLFMTNAPLATAVGGASWAAGVQILTPISQIFDTYQAAQEATAIDQIYVERAVAKVTMSTNNGTVTNSKIDGTGAITYNISGWELGNTNTLTYLLRNTYKSHPDVDGKNDMDVWGSLASNDPSANNYRFIGATEVKTGTGLYRTYFAVDPNYEDDADLTNATSVSTDFGTPKYCYENTFNVAKMTNKNTTHVVIEATLGSGADLFVVNEIKNNVYDDVNDIKQLVFNKLKEIGCLNDNLTGTLTVSGLDITLGAGALVGYPSVNYVVTAIALNTAGEGEYSDGGSAVNAALATPEVLNTVNSEVRVSKYAGGKSYYVARIKHFGDVETPWNQGETTTPSSGNVYPANSEANYLGRYGVLRNNWYDLAVTGISLIGEPSIEIVEGKEDDTDTDDELDSYITLQINILSWAKRTQNVEL